MRAALGLRLGFFFLLKLEDARVGLIGHFRKHQQVIAPEALRTLPFFAVLVETGEGDIVPRGTFGVVTPNRSLDTTDADFSDGFGDPPADRTPSRTSRHAALHCPQCG